MNQKKKFKLFSRMLRKIPGILNVNQTCLAKYSIMSFMAIVFQDVIPENVIPKLETNTT